MKQNVPPGPGVDATGQAVIDPTENVKDALAAAVERQDDLRSSQTQIAEAKREVITERLNGIDRATVILSERIDKVPASMREQVGHLSELVDEQLASIQTQFKERDTRQERESRDNKVAVDAAFAAQKEAAAAQDKANREAIDKSERATAETIKANQELGKSRADAQQKQLDDFGTRLTRIEAVKQGGQDLRGVLVGLAGLAIATVAVVVAIITVTR